MKSVFHLYSRLYYASFSYFIYIYQITAYVFAISITTEILVGTLPCLQRYNSLHFSLTPINNITLFIKLLTTILTLKIGNPVILIQLAQMSLPFLLKVYLRQLFV